MHKNSFSVPAVGKPSNKRQSGPSPGAMALTDEVRAATCLTQQSAFAYSQCFGGQHLSEVKKKKTIVIFVCVSDLETVSAYWSSTFIRMHSQHEQVPKKSDA